MLEIKDINQIQKMISDAIRSQPRQIIRQGDIPPQTIKGRHLEDMVIVRGLVADLPTDGGAVGILAYFGTDDDTLSIWNGTAWVGVTLT